MLRQARVSGQPGTAARFGAARRPDGADDL